jgi:hypothetical protein
MFRREIPGFLLFLERAGVDLRNELAEAARIGEVDAGARLAGVTVAAGDQRARVGAGQFDGVGIPAKLN